MTHERSYRCPGPVFDRWVENERGLVPTADLGDPTRTVTVGSPWGTTKPHDSDGQVPEYEDYFGAEERFAVSKMRGTSLGGVWVYRWHILYNLTKIEPFHPGPNDWRAIRRHERAHTRGWGHGEGTPETNGAFSPVVTITGT